MKSSFACAALCLMIVVLGGAGSPPWAFKSSNAMVAKVKYERAVSVAEEERVRQIGIARTAFIQELEKAKRDATKAADLDEAVNIDNAIRELKKGAPALGGELTMPVGTWQVAYTSGVVRTYRIDSAGGLTASERNSPPAKRLLTVKGGELIVEEGTDKVERLTLVGDRLFVEHFVSVKAYADGQNATIMGVGRLIESGK